MNLVGKTVNLNLAEGSTAEMLLDQFHYQAEKEGWTIEEIIRVKNEAMKGDFDHLIATLLEHSNVDEFEPEDEFWEDDSEDEDIYSPI